MYKKYVKGNSWRCSKSPSGAHHWVGMPSLDKGGYGIYVCKYCDEARRLPIEIEAARRVTDRRARRSMAEVA